MTVMVIIITFCASACSINIYAHFSSRLPILFNNKQLEVAYNLYCFQVISSTAS